MVPTETGWASYRRWCLGRVGRRHANDGDLCLAWSCVTLRGSAPLLSPVATTDSRPFWRTLCCNVTPLAWSIGARVFYGETVWLWCRKIVLPFERTVYQHHRRPCHSARPYVGKKKKYTEYKSNQRALCSLPLLWSEVIIACQRAAISTPDDTPTAKAKPGSTAPTAAEAPPHWHPWAPTT